MKRKMYLLAGMVGIVCIGGLIWRHQGNSGNLDNGTHLAATGTSVTPGVVRQASDAVKPSAVPTAPTPAKAALTAGAQAAGSREFDLAVNPYAGALREAGKSKREWDADYIKDFQTAKAGDPVKFELTGGVMAEGSVKIVQAAGSEVSYVSGELTAPEAGKFFFLTPPEGGKAGKAVGVVEFLASKRAYRVEPTGPNGDPELWQRHMDEVICMSMPPVDPVKMAADENTNAVENLVPLRPDLAPAYVPGYNSNIVSLQSYPGSPAVLLLDFAGGYTPTWGGIAYARPPVDNSTIKDIWKRIAEDFMPFNINVTTDLKVFQAATQGARQRCCFTTTPVTAAGVAYVGSWNWGGDTPCWSVYYVGKPAAEVGAHEPGHTLNLGHETAEVPDGNGGFIHVEYSAGHGGPGNTGWAPIMGVGYYQPVTTWCKGEFRSASNLQDQLAIIATANNGVTYRTDDTGDMLATSRYLEIYTNYTAFAEGVIERTDDTDAFQFTTTGGTVSLTANPVGDWADLALMATLANGTDTIIASDNPQNVLSASITTYLPAGTYTFRVTGAGRNDPLDNGFSSYASLGYYSITGSVAGARMPTRLSVAEHATNNTVVGTVPAINPNSSPLVYSIVSGNPGGTFAVDTNGVVSVANNTLLDYYPLAALTTMYGVQLEVFMNITNVNNPALTELNRRVVIAVQQLYPPKPTALTATLDSSLRVDLAWNASYGATSYYVKRSTTYGGPYTTLASPTAASYTDGGLTNGVTYYYVVSAVNANGESYNSAEAGVLVRAVAGGFESRSLGLGNFQYNPSGGGGWTFGGASPNGSGIVANGSGFGNPNAPEGVQAAFVQSYGTISQTFTGFTPGTTYQISYLAAQRSGYSEFWNVKIDNMVIQTNIPGSTSYAVYTATFVATSTAHTLSFVGTDLAGNADTVFLDNVQISIVTPVIANFSFETPSVGGYQYNPSGGSWTFSGASPNGSGILVNGSGFSNPNAPLGTQAAFVQEFGTTSQSLSGFTPGKTYTLSYLAAQRNLVNGGESWNVKIDSTVIQSNSPGSTSYAVYTASFMAAAATHTLSFVGTDLAGGDNTVFLDNVSISLAIQPNAAAAVTVTSPTNGTVFSAFAPVNLAASVTTNGNIINSVQFYADNTFLGQTASAPYVCAWANAPGGSHSLTARVLFNNGSFADSAPANIVIANGNPNFGFETPPVGSGNYTFVPNGASWSFSGFTGDGSGIAANGSGYSNPNAPEGMQAALLQCYGSISQPLTGFTPGTNYTITYSAAQRGAQNGGQTWNVAIDNAVISSNSPGTGATSYTTYTANFTASASAHTLAFVGTDLNGGDNTVFIDNVSITPPPATIVTPYVATNTLPATAADVVGSQVKFVAGFSSASPMTYQWQKVVGGVLSNIAGATNTTMTLTNLQLSDTALYRLQASNAFGIAVSTASPLTVSSMPAASNNVIASYAAQTGLGSAGPTFAPTWTMAAGSLINGRAPSSVGSGNFTQNTSLLTDGAFGTFPNGGGSSAEVTCGGGAGQSVTYTLNGSASGYNLTNIVVYGGWGDAGRDQQAYTVYYATVGNPANFILLSSVNFDPVNAASVQSATRATLAPASGVLASNVAALKFDFTTPPPENSYVGYSEIQVFGSVAPAVPAPLALTNTLPATAADVVGSQVTFTAAFSSAYPITYQWVKITNGVSGDIAGATNTVLALKNLQLSDTASYQLRASNMFGSSSSTASSLTVSNVPAAVSNVITACAAQTGLGGAVTTFTPTWTVAPGSLIAGQSPSSVGSGNFSADGPGTVAVLTDGSAGWSSYGAGAASASQVTGGGSYGRGQSVTYTLGGSTNGYTLANVVVYGGWCDAGRDQQAYTVYYSTVAAPTNFLLLSSVSYNPANPGAVQSATRVTLLPASGALATNVAAVKIDFTTPAGENGYEGYSEIQLFGSAAPAPIAPVLANNINPTNASAVVGGQQVFTAAFNGFTQPMSCQWLVNAGSGPVPISGETNTTLTLGNLQLINAGAYSLQASNAAGVSVSASATLVVNPAPVPDVNGIVISPANQAGPSPFTPTWSVDQINSVIYGLTPTAASGTFNLNGPRAGVNGLTTNINLTVSDVGGVQDPNYVATCGHGSSSGSQIIYTLTNSGSGYNLTNITVYSGWDDSGRHSQAYAVYYATAANPTSFIYLTAVNYSPSVAGNPPMANQVVISRASGGLIAANVYALKFLFSSPPSAGVPNGWSGYAAITVGGMAAAGAVAPALTMAASYQSGSSPFTPSWTAETPSLIRGRAPSSATGNFTGEGCGGTPVLTDGAIGRSGTISTFASCGGSAGTTLIYTLTNSHYGCDVTNIVVYNGWGDSGRYGQYYTLSYATVAATNTFIPLTTVYYLPLYTSGAPATRMAIAMNDGSKLAGGVAKIKFDFATPPNAAGFNNGWQGYSEIIVQGTSTQAVAANPTNIMYQVTGMVSKLSWPSDHTGWRLQAQTNSVAQGLGTNWFDVAGSTLTNQMSIPINPANGSVFFRMIYP